jgi:catechol 2,3-dioxygenase-like lactoylglutathione lyase family enzyme
MTVWMPVWAAHVTAVHSVGLTVSDLDKSVDFYTRVLPFSKLGETELAGETYERLTGVFGMRARVALLVLGDEYLVLTEFLAPHGRPAPVDARSNDRWFQHAAIVVSDMTKAYNWLHNRHVTFVSPNPQRIGGAKAFTFKDPDGHPLKILWLPEGKEDPKWHRENRGEKIFLGIDHTAVVVTSTEKSLRFYRDLLGFEVTGESADSGPEQERLNNVYGARLKVTTLRAASGPGIELLEYLTPAPCAEGQAPIPQIKLGDPASCGRAYPKDARPNDSIHGQTNLATTSADQDAAALMSAGVPSVSSGTVTLSADDKHHSKAFVVRDPDGHAVLIVEK